MKDAPPPPRGRTTCLRCVSYYPPPLVNGVCTVWSDSYFDKNEPPKQPDVIYYYVWYQSQTLSTSHALIMCSKRIDWNQRYFICDMIYVHKVLQYLPDKINTRTLLFRPNRITCLSDIVWKLFGFIWKFLQILCLIFLSSAIDWIFGQ